MQTNPLFVSLSAWFIDAYSSEAEQVATAALAASATARVFDEHRPELAAVIADYFKRGQVATNQVVDQEVALLADQFQVPWKYNKDVIDEIRDVSVFQGYYDRKYQGVYTRREIDNLKKTILRGKYNDWSEDMLKNEIDKTIKTTGNRARLLARTETQRLHETTQMVYYRQEDVQRMYKRVWFALSDARPSHQRMDGREANENGYFLSPDVGKVIGPGSGPKDFAIGCRCRTELIKR